MNYEQIDHTADFGLQFSGNTKEELFLSAAAGLFDSITDIDNVRCAERFDIEAEALDLEDLMIAWLRELLYYHHVKGYLFKEFSITEMTDTQIKGAACGERFDENRHSIKREIKAATYHDLSVREMEKGWKAIVIFDV